MKISVVTVTYNNDQTLSDTIESVLRQTYPQIEYIVVDGASEDNTVSLLKSYEPKFDGRMKWLSEPDEGLYDAMNKGIRMASGDIVGILNGDDFYNHPTALQQVVQTFQESGVQAVYADVRYVSANNTGRTVRYYSSRNFSPARFRFGFMPAHPTFFTYRQNFDEYGYYDTQYSIAADFDLEMRLLHTHKLSYQYIPLDMIKMRIGGKSNSSLRSNAILNKEICKICRRNGVYTNYPLLSLRYLIKIWEFVITKNPKNNKQQ
jgi:glycosyltransferase involved in cell wall biosynthesis